jgi:predicted enzyme related to lactoylglutathione lyase
MTVAIGIQHVVIDANDPQCVAAFWSAVLGRPITDDWGDFVRLTPDNTGTRIAFSAVPESKATKNRMHLDLAVGDRELAVTEVVALGGTLIETRSQGEHTWAVMADPEGNEFCLA